MNNSLKFLLGLSAGTVVGYTFSLLIAPEEGKLLRAKILKEADKMAKDLIVEGIEMAKKSHQNIQNS